MPLDAEAVDEAGCCQGDAAGMLQVVVFGIAGTETGILAAE
jgi:hypothetical protein